MSRRRFGRATKVGKRQLKRVDGNPTTGMLLYYSRHTYKQLTAGSLR